MIDTSKSIRWMFNNLLEAGTASIEVTSADPDKPFTNAVDPTQRTQTFKFGGRFLIEEDVNDKLYIDGNTFQVPADNYNSLEALLTAINTLIAAYTELIYDETNSVFFNGGGPYTINFSNQVEAIWETIGFTQTVDQVINGSVFQNDEPRMHWPYEEITIDFGYQASIGFIGIIGDLGQELKIPEGAEIRLMANTVNSFVAPPLNVTIPWHQRGAFRFIDDIEDSAWQFVKLRITCPTGPIIPEMGYLYIGEYEKFEDDRNIGTGFDADQEDYSELSVADSGAMYGNARTPARVFSSLEVGLAKPNHIALLKRIYALKGKITPFFVALDPSEYLSSEFDEYLAFVRFTDSPKQRHIIRDRFQLSFELREAL